MITMPRRVGGRSLVIALMIGAAPIAAGPAWAQTSPAPSGPLIDEAYEVDGRSIDAARACNRADMASALAELQRLETQAREVVQAAQAAGTFAAAGALAQAQSNLARITYLVGLARNRQPICPTPQATPAPTPAPTPTTPQATPAPTPTPQLGPIPIVPPSTAPDPWLGRLTEIRIRRNVAVRTCNRAALEEAIRAFEEFKRTSVAQAINPTVAAQRARLIDADIAGAREALTRCPAAPPGQAQPAPTPGQAQPTPPPTGQGQAPQVTPGQSTPRPAIDMEYYESLEGRFNRADARIAGLRVTGGCIRQDELEDFEKLVEDLRARLRTVEGVAATGLPTTPTVPQARQQLTDAEELLRQARAWSQPQCPPPADLFGDDEEDEDDDSPWWSFDIGYRHLIEDQTNIGMVTGSLDVVFDVAPGSSLAPFVGAGVSVSTGIFDEENEFSSGGTVFRSSLGIDFDLEAHVVVGVRLAPRFRLFTRAGYGQTEFRTSFESGGTSTDGSNGTDTLRYGLGAELMFDEDTGARATWTRWDDVFSDSGGVDADVFGIALFHRIGGSRSRR